MTPEEFCDKMKKLEDPEDPERAHASMDKLMCKPLRSLGYASGVYLLGNNLRFILLLSATQYYSH